MTRHQHPEVDEVKYQQPGYPRGGDIGRARMIAQQRHLAEERAFAEPDFLVRQIDLDLAASDEVHAVAGLALADDHGARRQVHGAQHTRDVGDRRRTEIRKEWHLAHGLPSLEKIVAPGLRGKAGGENTGPEPEHAEAAD